MTSLHKIKVKQFGPRLNQILIDLDDRPMSGIKSFKFEVDTDTGIPTATLEFYITDLTIEADGIHVKCNGEDITMSGVKF